MALTERYMTTTGAGAHDGTSESDAWSPLEAEAGLDAGMHLHVKTGVYLGSEYDTGAYIWLSNASPSTPPSLSAPIIIEGYRITPGDSDYPVVVFDAESGTGAVDAATLGDYVHLRNLGAKNAAAGSGFSFQLGAVSIAYRCAAVGGYNGFYLGDGSHAYGCSSKDNTVAGFFSEGYAALCIGCYVENSGAYAFYMANGWNYGLQKCLAVECPIGIWYQNLQTTLSPNVLSDTIVYGCTVGLFVKNRMETLVRNCIFENNTTAITGAAPGGLGVLNSLGTAFFGNAIDVASGNFEHAFYYPNREILSLERSAFLDAAEHDFRLSGSVPEFIRAAFPLAFLMGADLDQVTALNPAVYEPASIYLVQASEEGFGFGGLQV